MRAAALPRCATFGAADRPSVPGPRPASTQLMNLEGDALVVIRVSLVGHVHPCRLSERWLRIRMTRFEEAFFELVRTCVGELVRDHVREHLASLRGAPWVTKEEAARLLGCSPRSVSRHIALGRLATSKPAGSRVLIERSSIEELIEAARQPRQEWRHPWLSQPRILDERSQKSPAHVAAGKLGHQRRRDREAGIYDDITMQLIREGKLKPKHQ